MYILKNTDNGAKVTLRAWMSGENGGLNYINGYTFPAIDATLSLKGMDYRSRTAILDCTVKGSGAFSAYLTGTIAISIYGVALFTINVADIKFNTFEITQEVFLPYEEDGTMDHLNLVWEGRSLYGRNVKVQSATPYTDNPTEFPMDGFLRPLQQEPFFIKSFWSESNNPDNYYGKGYLVDESTKSNFSLCVPFIPERATKLRVVIPTVMGEDVGADALWEFVINNPTVGLYEGRFEIDGNGRYKLNEQVKAQGGGVTYGTSLLIGFALGDVYEAPASIATPFTIAISLEQPIVLGSVKDTNPVTIALTGDENVLVLHESNALATIQASATTGAVIKETGIQNGNEIMLNVASYNWLKVGSHIFDFYAKDNRSYVGSTRVEAPYIDYVKPTAVIKGSIITGEGNMNFKVSGNYFSGSFGLVDNEIFVYYRYKLQGAEDSEYTDWIRLSDIDINAEAKTYSVQSTVSGLDYEKVYVFQAHIADALNTIVGNEYVAVSVPIFDWSNEDFNFNVPVTIMGAKIGGENPILWTGNDMMAANANVQLSAPISSQMHGIVLVFSGTSDVSWNTAYVPKAMINLYNGGGHTFLMANNAGLSTFGAKYLYISDTSITGHATNVTDSSSAAASGIKFGNAYFSLRYVIGV